MKYKDKYRQAKGGFTLVEVMVVIAVLSILVTLTVFSVGNWRQRTAQGEVQNDLQAAAAAMQNAANFSGSYPATIPTSFTPSHNVTVTLIYSTSTTYCIQGTSKAVSGLLYSVSSTNTTPAANSC